MMSKKSIRRRVERVLWLCEMGRETEARNMLRRLFARGWKGETANVE